MVNIYIKNEKTDLLIPVIKIIEITPLNIS